ncbi:MAG: hypothetical protein A3J40_10480 [Erythrobacter sp. RIFCSPHIGHO2_12_FULL_63_10]|nr:MAG: hypothetical protein A3J40_10480 [Erythrobacter sp. RIFCSPHIGHO2_12_FULL_63_10]
MRPIQRERSIFSCISLPPQWVAGNGGQVKPSQRELKKIVEPSVSGDARCYILLAHPKFFAGQSIVL